MSDNRYRNMITVVLTVTIISQCVFVAVEWNRIGSYFNVPAAVIIILSDIVCLGLAFFKPFPIAYRAAIILLVPYITVVLSLSWCPCGGWVAGTAMIACAVCLHAPNTWMILETYTLGLIVIAAAVFNSWTDGTLKDIGSLIFFDAYLFNVLSLVVYSLHRFRGNQQKQLYRQTKAAELAVKARSDFLANINHEMRTPMNAILGLSSFLLKSELPALEYGYVTDIRSASQTLLTLINNVLDIAKVEAGKFEIIPVQYEVMSLINDIVSTVNVRFANTPVRFFVTLDPDLPNVLVGDEVRIQQVILNFISNAVKFTKRGFVSLTLRGIVSNERLLLYVSVHDTGSGIKEADVQKLFGLFQQVDTKRNRVAAGSGLGLAISRNLIEMMNGTVYVETAWGEGSTFSFVVPQEFGTVLQPLVPVNDMRQYRLAVLETDPYALERWEQMLESLNISYRLSTSPIDFLSSVHSKRFTHYFVCEGLYAKVSRELKEKNLSAVLLLRHDTKVDDSHNVSYLRSPIHSYKLWQILCGIKDDALKPHAIASTYSFTAPECRILVVDDNKLNLKIAAGLLEPYKIIVRTCESGKECLEEIKYNFFDVIMMDHMMPEMDGFETVANIRTIEGKYFKTIPIILVTANTVSGVEETCLASGFNGFIAKPIETAVLEKVLLQWLPKKKVLIQHTSTESDITPEPDAAVKSELEAEPEEKKQQKVNLLDAATGLKYTGGNREIYVSLLYDFASAAPGAIAKIRKIFAEKQWQSFTIEVHAVKSISKTFGAMPLHTLSLEMEHAGKEGNEFFIAQHIEEYLALYAETAVRVHHYLEHNE
ncbi:MAG: response regulator [Planctomycetaceae bacterium]|jgi:signal transduction histidine kinase/CheY-like chemotaxis protein/HPt (histidine-containing phosphotransfer) domain-containing protein|nr:response regulator [Planctomycetaceae bacterium]